MTPADIMREAARVVRAGWDVVNGELHADVRGVTLRVERVDLATWRFVASVGDRRAELGTAPDPVAALREGKPALRGALGSLKEHLLDVAAQHDHDAAALRKRARDLTGVWLML